MKRYLTTGTAVLACSIQAALAEEANHTKSEEVSPILQSEEDKQNKHMLEQNKHEELHQIKKDDEFHMAFTPPSDQYEKEFREKLHADSPPVNSP